MTKLIFGDDETIAGWVKSHIKHMRGGDFSPGYVAIGVAKHDKIVAGIVYHNYYPDDRAIELSMAAVSPLWATKEVIASLLHYPFEQLKCVRITTCTSARNKRALKFNYGIGFKKEGVIRRGCGGNHDLIICGMLRNDAMRWLNKGENNG